MTHSPYAPLPDDEDAVLAKSLKTVDHDAAPVDAGTIDRIRTAATAAFEVAPLPQVAGADRPAGWGGGESANKPTRSTLTHWLSSLLVASLAGAAFFVVIFEREGSVQGLAFGDVLKRFNDIDTLQLKVVRDGESADVFIRQPGVVRWEESPSRYRIARGSRLWEIDAEAESDVASQQNPWFGPRGEIDLLAMVNVRPTDRASLLRAKPSGREAFQGKSCLVYRRIVSSEGKSVRLEAYVDAETEQLIGLIARNPDAARDGPPLSELTLIALNPDMDESKFRIPVHLAESDRIGKVTDLQGIVVLRPVGARRWTPLCREMIVQAGDWLRTDVRGANAATVELASHQRLVIGPGSLVEIISPDEGRVHTGTVQIIRSDETPNDFVLRGLGEDLVTLNAVGESLYRLDRGRLGKMPAKPRWLEGYEGHSAEDSIGSLIVSIDGRDEPLTVGEHHVTVEIRDQIARTTIEETFVNHTSSRMEGTFHFPLPQDASISGFGMWINNELIEADIVEKQRAREIYETILREKRDPGLLEWTGGNIFKARVFPIEAHSEKRVKIVYTQVLPLRGNRFRYSYGLRSEMLATHPLRELNIRVQVNSEVPLTQVESPTHTCRTQLTPHAAELEFTAQEYTPTKDFEVVCEVDHRENDVVTIPHQRGEDGYFLLQLMPPGNVGDWRRELLPDGDPLELILLCDTSGSMDSTMRRTQAEFVASILASLGDRDRFNLAACDVGTVWAMDGFTASTADTTAKVRDFLDNRVSLGWTDLDQAFAAVLEKATPNSQVIYIGDGIVSTGDADSAAFVTRLRRIWNSGQKSEVKRQRDVPSALNSPLPTTHSISVGSAYESVVLKGIAGLSGGSMRQISGETTPQQAALELLNEIAQPGLRDVRVEFRGLKVAAVYPETLPNIAAGTQQILVGRYLPEGKNQRGEVVVTGTRDGEPVKFVARIELEEAEAGNSFIPRLWARARLDQLLQQGSSPQIQDEIIGLSEDFHIITPYSSLLVLESDADRERFGVKRRFEMRDGERFFAEGRDNANYALRQQQMQRAGNWRLGLRRQVLARLASLGRDSRIFEAWAALHEQQTLQTRIYPVADLFMPTGFSAGAYGENQLRLGRGISSLRDDRWSMPGFADTVDLSTVLSEGFDFGNWSGAKYDDDPLDAEYSPPSDSPAEMPLNEMLESRLFDMDGSIPMQLRGEWDEKEIPQLLDYRFNEFEERPALAFEQANQLREWGGRSDYNRRQVGRDAYAGAGVQLFVEPRMIRRASLDLAGLLPDAAEVAQFQWGRSYGSRISPVENLFPYLPPPVKQSGEDLRQEGTEGTKVPWSDEAKNLSMLLERADALREMAGGIRIQRSAQSWSTSWDRLVPAPARLELWSVGRWLTRDHGQGQQPILNWCDAETRGILSEAFLLGRRRPATAEDVAELPLYLGDHSLTPLHRTYRHYTAVVEHSQADRAVLVLTTDHDKEVTLRFTIDTTRNVLARFEQRRGDVLTQAQDFTDFVEIAGMWWATRITTTNGRDGHPSYVVTQTVEALEAETFVAAFDNESASREVAQFVALPLPEIAAARQSAKDGQPSFEDRFVLLLDLCTQQKWEQAYAELKHLEAMASEKQGLKWVRAAVNQMADRREDLRQQLEQFVPGIAALGEEAAAGPDLPVASLLADLFLANHLLGTAYPITSWQEYDPLVTGLKLVYQRQTDRELSMLDWNDKQLSVLDALGRSEEALNLAKSMAESIPGDPGRQIAYAQRLANFSRIEEEFQFLREQLAQDHWDDGERTVLREHYADRLENRGEIEPLLAFLREWLADEPSSRSPYARLLYALVMGDEVDSADTTVREWLDLVEAEGGLSGPDGGRVEAAIQFCLGSGHRLYHYNGMDPRWRQPLLKVALTCVPRDDRQQFAKQFVDNDRFHPTDEGDRLRGYLLGWLLDGVETLPVSRMRSQLGWLQSGRLLMGGGEALEIRQVTTQEWTQLADGLLARWEQETDEHLQQEFAMLLDTLHAGFVEERRLPFVRRVIDEGSERHRQYWKGQLFALLQQQPWTEEIEEEAFALWPTVVEADIKPVELSVWTRVSGLVPTLYGLVDAMLRNRIAAAQRALQDDGHTDELTRTELAEKQSAFVMAAREGVAARIDRVLADRAFGNDELIPWLQLERAWLDILLDRNREQVLQTCWALLGDTPPKFAPEQEVTAALLVDETLQSALRQRAWAMVLNLATRRNAEEELIARVLSYISAGIEQSQVSREAAPAQLDPDVEALNSQLAALNSHWKQTKYDYLIALDRPDELVVELRRWIETDRPNVHWRRTLARLLAERGELQAAITLFEGLKTEDELQLADLQTLADWYLVEDRRADYERSRIDAFKQMDEWQLGNLLGQQANQLNSGNGPHELDETALFMLTALFEKTSHPPNHFYVLRQLYTATHDFRLLERVPESILGRSRQQVYAALGQLESSVLSELRNEATADEAVAYIHKRRAELLAGIVPRGADPNERSLQVDLRALDLIEAQIERKCAEVLNQPGPHIDQALAALRRAFDRDWGSGERLQMAALLQDLGPISQEKLAAEQLRQLKQLYDDSEPRSIDRARIGAANATLLFNGYSRRQEGLTFFEAALRELAEPTNGLVPEAAADMVLTYSSFVQGTGAFLHAESYVQKQLDGATTDGLKLSYVDHLNQLHFSALQYPARTSLGEGEALYRGLASRLLDQCDTVDDNRRYNIVYLLIQVYGHACSQKLGGAQGEFLSFANNTLPELLATQQNNYGSLISQAADWIANSVGHLDALSFLLTRFENYPPRFQYDGNDRWQQHGHRLADFRVRAREKLAPERQAEVRELEARLLPLVLAELRRDLSSQQSRGQSFYTQNHHGYWPEHEADYRRIAEEVLAEHRDSPRTHVYVAHYLYYGLPAFDRAIEVMFAAHRRGLLDDPGIEQLVSYLFDRNRYAESIALLEPLMDRSPDRMSLRVQLMTAYHQTKRAGQLAALIDQTDAHFHQLGRWTESNIAMFAEGCLNVGHDERAAGYFEEAINLHQRTAPNRGIGDGSLSSYYAQASAAYSKLGDTRRAADAAAGAIVSWGNNQSNRAAALESLRYVYRNAPDLANYIHGLDQEAEETGTDSPVLRKALGTVLLEKQDYAGAVVQLQKAIELQPTDREVHQSLVTCFDRLEDSDGAIRQLLVQIDFDRHNLAAYTMLANRTRDDAALSERAATSLVEAAPNEAENHQAIATLREEAGRWGDAISHWKRVSELRRLEPTGLLGLAKAQLHEQQWEPARETLRTLRRREWPSHFADVDAQTLELEKQIPR